VVSPEAARPIALAIFLLSAFVMFGIWRRNPSNSPFALTVLLAIFTSPHLHGHDLALLVISFATLSSINALFVLVSSLALGAFDIIWTDWRYAVAQLVMGLLLVVSIRDVWIRDARNPALEAKEA